jgi:hypothetical protein
MKLRSDKLQSALSLFALLIIGSFLVMSCGIRLQPEGVIRFKIVSKREYERAQLVFPASEEHRAPLRLRFLDTNVWQTSATLQPGKYFFNVHSSDGSFHAQEITIVAGKDYYELPDFKQNTNAPTQGPTLSGVLSVESGKLPKEVVIVFAADDVIIRRAALTNGKFTVESPSSGKFRVEIIAPGNPPLTHTRSEVDMSKAVDLGAITLR